MINRQGPVASNGQWLVVALIGACAVAAACGSGAAGNPGATPSTEDAGGKGDGGAGGGSGSDGGDANVPGAGGDVPDGGALPEGATTANLKVAFIGDTAAGSDFRNVLKLVKAEGAEALFVQGDVTYGGDNAADWFPVIDSEINAKAPGSTATATIPYFVSKGNHDIDWGNIGSGLKTRIAAWGVGSDHNDPTAINYSIVYKGLKIVMVSDDETANPTRAGYVSQRLQGDNHLWKICSWHKNMRASNAGPKNDEMGWAIYENCRSAGAIVAQGHSHTYSRSKTLTDTGSQTVDPACSNPFGLCVGPGKHFFFDSSLGGVDTRPLNATVAAKPYWASTFTGNFGALFITFHVDGDPRKARGYFKTVGGTVVDPPAASGKTSFEIRSTN